MPARRLIIEFADDGFPNILPVGDIPAHWLFAVAAQLTEQALLPIRQTIARAAQQQARQDPSRIVVPNLVPRGG